MAKIAKTILVAAQAMLAAKAANSVGNIAGADLIEFYNAHAERFGKQPVKKFKDRPSSEARVLELAQIIVDAANAPPAEKPAADPAGTSAAIAASWADPSVRAARTARHAVTSGGVAYPSVRKAMEALGLDGARSGAVRAKLVKAGVAEFGGHKFARA